MKMDAVAMLQEWVRDVGSKAGLTSSNTRLSSGAVGVPESRLEVSCYFKFATLCFFSVQQRIVPSDMLLWVQLGVMQLEVEFDSFAQLEGFWGAIPPVEHKAWSQRVQVVPVLMKALLYNMVSWDFQASGATDSQ